MKLTESVRERIERFYDPNRKEFEVHIVVTGGLLLVLGLFSPVGGGALIFLGALPILYVFMKPRKKEN